MPTARANDVRHRILEAALGLLAEQGFIELTQPSVAKAAGVRQSHLTYYFPTRADLLKAVAVHSIESLLGGFAAKAPPGGLTPAVVSRLVGAALADKRRARVMLGLVVSSDEDREIKRFLREFVARIRREMTALAKLLGAAPSATDVAAFHAMLVGAAVLQVARDDAASRRECSELAGAAVARLVASRRTPAGAQAGRGARVAAQ